MPNFILSFRRLLFFLSLIPFAATTLAQTASLAILTSFGRRGPSDGKVPTASVVFDAAGNLYGTTSQGGRYGSSAGGIVYMMSKKDDGTWTRRTLFDFSTDYSPTGPLATDPSGVLFGTTQLGGPNAAGAVYQLTPTQSGRWVRKVLFRFPPAHPFGHPTGIIRDPEGNLYTGVWTGSSGTIYKISPAADGEWTATVICSFDSSRGGPVAMIMDTAGDLYGVTRNGSLGTFVFRLARPTNGGKIWAYTTLHRFSVANTGSQANSIAMDSLGNLYGASDGGGYNGLGSVFEVPAGQAVNGPDVILYTFGIGSATGATLPFGITVDPSGTLIGIASYGGPPPPGLQNGGGKAFEIIPREEGNWNIRSLHNFGSIAVPDPATGGYLYLDGIIPSAPLTQGPDGAYYGITNLGGYASNGTVFKLTLHPPTTEALTDHPQ